MGQVLVRIVTSKVKMEVNPYQPPLMTEPDNPQPNLKRQIVRAGIIAYGSCFVLIVLSLNFDGLVAGSVYEAGLCVLFGCTAYGIFAYAIPRLRIRNMGLVWWYFAWAIPLITIVAATIETINEMPLNASQYLAKGLFVFVVYSPAVVINFLLAKSTSSSISQLRQARSDVS